MSLLRFFFVLALFRLCAGHGYVGNVLIGGQSYPGWNPFVDPYTSTPARVVRKVLNDGPVNYTDPDIDCNHLGNNGTAAIATAPAGSGVTFQWAYWPSDHQGPVSTYMTSCNGDCSTFLANGAKWFKLDADGYDPSSKTWAAAKLIADNNSWTSTIPAGLAPGNYLLRNEIIALHSSPPQWYPSCSQVQVTGSGQGVPSEDELTTMLALYTGVVFPDIWGDSVSFDIPGPAPVTFDAESTSGDGGSASVNPTNSPVSSSPSSVSGSTASPVMSQGPTATTATDSAPTIPPTTNCRVASRKLLRRRRLA